MRKVGSGNGVVSELVEGGGSSCDLWNVTKDLSSLRYVSSCDLWNVTKDLSSLRYVSSCDLWNVTKDLSPLRYVSSSDPGGIQTHDLQNRNLTLYSAKLQGLR